MVPDDLRNDQSHCVHDGRSDGCAASSGVSAETGGGRGGGAFQAEVYGFVFGGNSLFLFSVDGCASSLRVLPSIRQYVILRLQLTAWSEAKDRSDARSEKEG